MTARQAEPGNHYTWGSGCDGWILLETDDQSVIEERMPPGSAELPHLHQRARQFFYVLDGTAVMRTPRGDVELTPRQGIAIAPRTPHQMRNDSRADLRFLAISTPSTRGDRTEVGPSDA